MSKLKVLTAPDPFLKKKALTLDSVDDSIRKLMNDMLATIYENRGIGLAATQVGVLKRVLVLDLQEDEDQERDEGFYPLFIANPGIVKISQKTKFMEEGCMSVPQQRISVQRPVSVKIKYIDYNNKEQELGAEGLLARAVQHEIDHLNGKLLIDYLSNLKKNMVLRKLSKLKNFSI